MKYFITTPPHGGPVMKWGITNQTPGVVNGEVELVDRERAIDTLTNYFNEDSSVVVIMIEEYNLVLKSEQETSDDTIIAMTPTPASANLWMVEGPAEAVMEALSGAPEGETEQ